MKYAYAIEKASNGFSAYIPDLPGCIAGAASEPETRSLIEEAIEFHIEGLRLHGDPVPHPTTLTGYAEVA